MLQIGRLGRVLITLALVLLLNNEVHSGQKMNPHTRKLDYCLTIEEEDGTPSAKQCKPIRIPNGSLTDNDSYYSWLGATSLTGLSDVGSATATAGNMLIGDGTDFESISMSGDMTIDSAGAMIWAGNTISMSGTIVTTGGYLKIGSGLDQNETAIVIDRASTDPTITWDNDDEEWVFNYPINAGGSDNKITFGNSEYITNASDDIVEMCGVGGTDNTCIHFDLDGTFPTMGSTVDDIISIKDVLYVDSANSRVGIGTTAPGASLEVVGVTKMKDDTFWTGSGAGLPFGGMYSAAVIAVTMTDQNTWYEIDAVQAWTTCLVNLATFTDPYVAVTNAGIYQIAWSISGSCDTADQHIEIGIILDQDVGLIQPRGQSHNQVKFADREMNYASITKLSLSAGQKVSFAVRNTTSGGDVFSVHAGDLSITMIGGN